MRISGLQKLSLLDFPEKLAATVFTGGCNLRCPFCHNAGLVTHLSDAPNIPLDEFFSFLKSRRGKLDGVCITGGEPLLQEGLREFIINIRQLGFDVKLDTNGCFPERLRALIDEGLLDYVAMDVKNTPSRYAETVGVKNFDISPILESIGLLKQGRVPYEFRTTLVKGLHHVEDLPELGKLLSGAEKYFLQNFCDSGDLVGPDSDSSFVQMDSFSGEELENITKILKKDVVSVKLRV